LDQGGAEALALADDLVAYSDALADLERNAEAFAAAEQAVAKAKETVKGADFELLFRKSLELVR